MRDKDKKVLEEKAKEVLTVFRDMGAEGILETHPTLEAFLMASPGLCEGLRIHKMKSSNAAHLMPLYDYWRGHTRAGVPLSQSGTECFSHSIPLLRNFSTGMPLSLEDREVVRALASLK